MDCIKQHRPDVAILDIAMPIIDGYEIARQLRAEIDAPLKLVALSGLAQSVRQERRPRSGF